MSKEEPGNTDEEIAPVAKPAAAGEESAPAPDDASLPEPFQPWECPCCHERNDGNFDICWNCQTQRE